MLKVFIILFLILSPALLLKAQDEPTHTLPELQTLLQKAPVDSQRVSLLLESALVYAMRRGMEKNDFDSALHFINQAMNVRGYANEPVWQARCLTVLSQLYREADQKEKGRSYIDSAIDIFTKYDVKDGLANANMELQNYYDILSDSEWMYKIKYTEGAVRLYRESGNKLKQAHLLKHLGDFYQVRGEDSVALNRLHEALAIYKSLNYEQVQGVYDLIGYILNVTDYHQALKYGLLAVQTAERLKAGEGELCTIYNRVGQTYYRLTQYREAANYFDKSFTLALKNRDSMSAALVAVNLLDTYLRMRSQQELLAFFQKARFLYDKDELGARDIYLSRYILAHLLNNDHRKAEPYVKELQQLVKEGSPVQIRRSFYRAIVPYYFAAGQYNEMYKYLVANEAICKQLNTVTGLTDNYLWWYRADSALGNHADAVKHFKLYKDGSDSSLRLTASQQINQLLVQHETYKKDQEIVTLTSQAEMHREQLRQTRLVRNLSYGLAGLLLLVMALLYNRYRLKQRSNKKLEQQQQEINDKNIILEKLVSQKEKLLVDKEWLLKEVHHRVKNNMHMVISLLNLQSAYIDNEMALSAIHESENRVHAMSLIHQKLYNTDNVSSIDMSVYIRELVTHLGESFNKRQNIRFELSVESIELDVSQAVPLGLILNEVVTNSIKYAFPNNEVGVISVSLTNTYFEHCLLIISDNGIGMPSSIPDKKTGSLGMSLIIGLSEDLEGNVSIENNNGTTIKISFVKRPVVRPPGEASEMNFYS